MHHLNAEVGKQESWRLVVKRSLLFALVIVIFSKALFPQQNRALMEPTDREVALAGVLHQVNGYGPPGYGETKNVDVRIRYWALDLPETITLACEPDTPELASIQCQSVRRIRLFVPLPPEGDRLERMAKKLEGKRIVVTGVLHRRATMAEITPIYMDVTDIDLPKAAL
jgi:hypothetical protein